MPSILPKLTNRPMEEVLPPITQNSAGFEPVQVRQLTVFLENRVGQLQQLVQTYERAGGRISSLMVETSADTALIRMLCADPDLAQTVIKEAGYAFSEQQLLVAELPKNASAPVHMLCSALLAAEINIHYAYPLLVSPRGPALALYVDDLILAGQVLVRKGFTLIGESDLGGK